MEARSNRQSRAEEPIDISGAQVKARDSSRVADSEWTDVQPGFALLDEVIGYTPGRHDIRGILEDVWTHVMCDVVLLEPEEEPADPFSDDHEAHKATVQAAADAVAKKIKEDAGAHAQAEAEAEAEAEAVVKDTVPVFPGQQCSPRSPLGEEVTHHMDMNEFLTGQTEAVLDSRVLLRSPRCQQRSKAASDAVEAFQQWLGAMRSTFPGPAVHVARLA